MSGSESEKIDNWRKALGRSAAACIQQMTVAAIETFHYVHQYINAKMREEDPKIPELYEEHPVIYAVIPICMIISLFLAVIWIIPKKINRKIELGLAGCFFGAIMMLSNTVLSMRVAQLYINLDEVSDEDLLMHPIFIHAFTICILDVFAMTVYLLHFWLFYELWRWNRKLRTLSATSSRTSGNMTQTSSKFISNSYSSNKKRLDYDNSSSFELSDKNSSTPPRGHVGIKDINDEPSVAYILYLSTSKYRTSRDAIHEDIMANITRLAIIKFFELILVCIIIGLHWHSFNYTDHVTQFLSTGTAGGYLIIFIGLFAGGIMGTPVNRRIDLFFSLVGCALFVASGALVIQAFDKLSHRSDFRDKGLARGSLCVIEGALLLVDSFLTFRGEA
ncbi:hypothetical protein PV328_006632 [Microctonus aethiopoides]|uniref:Uncharacterized protein n=1 Tax=Microctonus aethiopoides TaxID=144406 RepID=A0AA39FPY3_9HYME|nr:hypothetical protein PV328_006632 [Microctonus aethiopoides]